MVSGTGQIAPGAGPGVLNVNGAVTYTGGALNVDLNGTTAGTLYDRLAVTGAANLGAGAAGLLTTLGYAPSSGDQLTILTAGSVTGNFTGLPNNATFLVGSFNSTPYLATIQYQPASVILTNFTPVPEPAGILASCLGAVGVAGWWRRKTAKKSLAGADGIATRQKRIARDESVKRRYGVYQRFEDSPRLTKWWQRPPTKLSGTSR
jgi:hypothetical protein